MLRMVLLSVSIAIFLRQLVLFSFSLIWLPTFRLRLFPWLFFSLIDNPPLLLRDQLPTKVFLVLLLPMPISVVFVVSATFFFHLVSAPS
jgi:hypothetical protein